MLKEAVTYNVTSYEAGYGFMVDIVDDFEESSGTDMWSAWLYRKNIGVKSYIEGRPRSQVHTVTAFLAEIENILVEMFKMYDDEFCREDDVDRGYLD